MRENKTNLNEEDALRKDEDMEVKQPNNIPESVPGIDENHGFKFSEISTAPSYLRINPLPSNYKDLPVLFLDMDNTLYSKSLGLSNQMKERIGMYFERFLGIPQEESVALGEKYFLDYGLAIRGLIKHFKIDPVEYDRFVDGGLDLDELIKPDLELKKMLKQCKARCWVFTNAGLYHAERVLRLLDIYEKFEGILYCDYRENNFPSKPERLAYERAMLVTQIENSQKQSVYFADDSVTNVASSLAVGWEAVLIDEPMDVNLEMAINKRDNDHDLDVPDIKIQKRIRYIHELPKVFPELFG